MLKNRIVLTLMFEDGILVNSNNFILNKIAEIKTLLQYLDFESIDELVLIDVSRSNNNIEQFCKITQEITKECFIPVTIGGGIRSFEDAKIVFNSGGDKVIINTLLFENEKEIQKIANVYGKQSIVLSLDVKKIDEKYYCFYKNGTINSTILLEGILGKIDKLNVGDILLRSIDNDGKGNGYDIELLKFAIDLTSIPVIIAGGVGNFNHLSEGIKSGAQAVSIGNLFHFIGYKMNEVKIALRNDGLEIPSMWNH